MAEEIPGVEFEDNTNERLPCVVVLDTSTSMEGDPIRQLNEGLQALEKDLKTDDIARMRVQLLLISAGGHDEANILTEWTDARHFSSPTVTAYGSTPLGKAMDLALNKIEEQKQQYDANAIPSKRPWIFLISDGQPNDHGWEAVARKCCQDENDKKVSIFAIGTEEADLDQLSQFTPKGAKRLKGLQFRELFIWLSRSAKTASKTGPGESVQLPARDSWEAAET